MTTLSISATEFAKNFGKYREAAQREPVEITSHGRPSGYFVSTQEFAELQRLRSLERRAYSIGSIPDELAAAIAGAAMSAAHDHLNQLLDQDE